MQLEILGASGGIETNSFTSSYLINSSILFDAGTGLGRLSLGEQAGIKKIFLTHANMDRCCASSMFWLRMPIWTTFAACR